MNIFNSINVRGRGGLPRLDLKQIVGLVGIYFRFLNPSKLFICILMFRWRVIGHLLPPPGLEPPDDCCC